MNGVYDLPTSINIRGTDYAIRHDFRPCIDIMLAFEDADLTQEEKVMTMMDILYVDRVPVCAEAIQKAYAFLDGQIDGEEQKDSGAAKRLYTFTQDGKYIISAVDKVLGYSTRRCEYLHWWEFLSAFLEVGECLFSTIVNMRRQKSRGKLTKEERMLWAENKEMFELRPLLTVQEKEEIEEYKRILSGGGDKS